MTLYRFAPGEVNNTPSMALTFPKEREGLRRAYAMVRSWESIGPSYRYRRVNRHTFHIFNNDELHSTLILKDA